MNALAWRVTLAAAALVAVVAGGRASLGLFVSPLNTASGIGLSGLSLGMALGQLALGLTQPLIGAVVDRHGARRVIGVGALMLALATAWPALQPTPAVVWLSVIVAAVAGSAVASNGLLVGEIGRSVPTRSNGLALGLMGVGTSVGPLLMGPLTQWTIEARDWVVALVLCALLSLLALPLAAAMPRRERSTCARPQVAGGSIGRVLREWRFWRVALSFGACGFHVAFLATHMPGAIERCGLPPGLAGTWIGVSALANIAGSVGMGLALRRHDPARLLAGTYLARALSIGVVLAAPASTPLMLLFALLMGITHMATLPPTSALVARQHGVERLGTLFGVVMLVHQVGAFAGVALGGWMAARTGHDTASWVIGAALALAAMALAWRSRAPRAPAAHVEAVSG